MANANINWLELNKENVSKAGKALRLLADSRAASIIGIVNEKDNIGCDEITAKGQEHNLTRSTVDRSLVKLERAGVVNSMQKKIRKRVSLHNASKPQYADFDAQNGAHVFSLDKTKLGAFLSDLSKSGIDLSKEKYKKYKTKYQIQNKHHKSTFIHAELKSLSDVVECLIDGEQFRLLKEIEKKPCTDSELIIDSISVLLTKEQLKLKVGEKIELLQPGINKRLNRLATCNLTKRERDGNSMMNSLNLDNFDKIVDFLRSGSCLSFDNAVYERRPKIPKYLSKIPLIQQPKMKK